MAISKEQIERINALARKKKDGGLSPEEQEEQAVLRRAYIDSVKENFRSQVENVKLVDDDGRDITPDKLKKLQKERGLRE
ncbi:MULTISPECIES: DUF896 domain-containing protein [unclassified Lactococcus]|uniref:DUF896 domain-containing protein n=1 Tax=unclassified Lactococcus TaxID=2643510 RepID=UPI0011CC80A8|nr:MULTISPECIES: DUF896 domain-containing protein [unclassified Lactococcus]MQW23112.1 DUF896 domain-containing protein [Lactococcus sp. dk101]TXK44166.1 DUF896 domain-containing protein [Lactococcus sp. dk310]TXK49897.1 DUF896 domain-containing protein [Lactococcus sp. dk322]